MSVSVVFHSESGQSLAVCQETDLVGDWVYVRDDTDPSGKPTVGVIDISNRNTLPTFGVITKKITTTSCVVRSSGKVNLFSGLTPGKQYWLGPTGIQNTAPHPTMGSLYSQSVGIALGTEEFLVRISDVVIKRKV